MPRLVWGARRAGRIGLGAVVRALTSGYVLFYTKKAEQGVHDSSSSSLALSHSLLLSLSSLLSLPLSSLLSLSLPLPPQLFCCFRNVLLLVYINSSAVHHFLASLSCLSPPFPLRSSFSAIRSPSRPSCPSCDVVYLKGNCSGGMEVYLLGSRPRTGRCSRSCSPFLDILMGHR
jgi:hypothetical protein